MGSGFNSRMCDALVEMTAKGTCDYQLEIDWGVTSPPSLELQEISPLRITPMVVEALEEASVLLKKVSPHAYTIEEYVSNLHCSKDPKADSSSRRIALVHTHSVYGRIEILVGLGPKEYIDAVEAHRDSKALSISGMLQRVGSTWSLIELKNFHVIGQITH
jgi:hypothetical protein